VLDHAITMRLDGYTNATNNGTHTMTTQPETIHTAYSISRRGGTTYRAVAYVLRVMPEGTFKHTRRISLDDTAQDAQESAVNYILEQYRKDGLDLPVSATHHGKHSALIVDNLLF